jgi:hypothetical protein
MKSILIKLLVLLLLTSCSSAKYLDARETAFGTKGAKKWIFHRLSDRDKGTPLAFPGYIVGIEKAFRSKIGAPSKQEVHHNNGLEKFGFNDNNTWELIPKRKRRVLDDKKPMFVSSIYKFEHQNKTIPKIVASPIYDAYNVSDLAKPTDAYDQGFEVLDAFKTELETTIAKDKITHVFLFSMGWNSDQQEAIRNFNSLFLKILDNAERSDKEFRPLFIGLTWPSKWSDKWHNFASFFNKSNDADEIGMTWGNYLLNKVILNKNNTNTYKTVVVGHSFGAKLTSRAVMSAGMLAEESKPVDLLINLQSAYSLNRFSATKGVEPYRDYVNWKQHANNVALIASKHDKAVTKGFYAPFAGGIKAYNKVKNDTEGHYKGIDLVKYNTAPLTIFKADKQLLMIDASAIIKQAAYKKGGKAHSDIYNDEVSKLLWDLIASKTY